MSRPAASPPPPRSAPESVRLDVWLDVACLFKTRSQAAAACKGGKVDVNGEGAKPNKPVKPGDAIRISRPGQRQELLVVAVAEHSLPKPEARLLYEDRTPPPSPEDLEMRRLLRQAGYRPPAKAPDKRERRELRRRKEEAPEE